MENITDKSQIYKALISVQSVISNPDKNVEGYGYKYTDLATLLDLVKPVLAQAKLGLMQQTISTTAGGTGFFAGVRTILIHESGESIESEYYLPLPEMKSQTQAAGAAITYARRYALAALLNIASDEDTDGASTQEAKKTFPGARTQPTANGTQGQYQYKNTEDNCDHLTTSVFVSKSEKNAGKPFTKCMDCGKFMGFTTQG